LPEPCPASNSAGNGIAAAKAASQYPLIIKHLWHAPLLQAADQVIAYRDLRRFTYRAVTSRMDRYARQGVELMAECGATG
jgi:fatty-acyl-CoA synthase